MLYRLLLIVLFVVALSACQDKQVQQDDSISTEQETAKTALETNDKISHLLVGTGSVQGAYFPIGGVICRLVNRHKHLHKIRCSLESTSGSIANLRDLEQQKFDLVFAQSDWQYHAYNGSSTFEKDGPNKNLRAVFALEADPLALLVPQDSEVNSFDDLADKRVSFGYTRSLQHRIINDFLAVKKWTNKNFKEIRPMSDERQVRQICEGQLDAILLLSSSLSDRLRNLSGDCKLRMLPIEGDEVKQVIAQKPYYRTAKVLRGMFIESEQEILSFGLGATAVADESTSPKAIYHIVKEVAENFNDFKSLHPTLAALDKRELSNAGIAIPLHPGAVRYYREARLLKN